MQIREIMTTPVHTISPEATLREAADMMDDRNVGILPVCDNDRLVGVITDRDIVIRSTSAGQNPSEARVRDSMTSPAIFCFDDQNVEEVAKLLRSKQIRRALVLDRNWRLQGMTSLDDFLLKTHDIDLVTAVIKHVHEISKTPQQNAA